MSEMRLTVRSAWCDGGELLELADPRDPLVWLQSDRQAVGIGVAAKVTATGPDRITALQSAWQRLVAAATVSDTVQQPGSGLVAFSSITFSGTSSTESCLIVPRVTVYRVGDRFFRTTVTREGDATGMDGWTDSPQPLHRWLPVSFQAPDDPVAQLQHRAGVEKALAEIAAGRVQKLVLARQVTATVPAGADLRVPLARLADAYPDCTSFAIAGFVGATPETLARVVAGQLRARVLAGTVPRGTGAAGAQAGSGSPAAAEKFTAESDAAASASNFLRTDPDIAAEHNYAVESVLRALQPLTVNLRCSDNTTVIELPNVWHRATDITATLGQGCSSFDLLQAMHPTAAVAGTPTAAAVDLIAEIEECDRGRYAGAVGWVSAAGDAEWVLALRCAQVDRADAAGVRRVTAFAGGGLVANSDPGVEFVETEAKLVPVRAAFGEG